MTSPLFVIFSIYYLLLMEENEVWRDIEGYEGLYQVSNLGRVRSLKYGKERILRPKDVRGYLLVDLCKEGKKKTFQIHRLVGQAFIPNPEGLPQINHKDENPKNNQTDNLEWCTTLYNNTYGTRTERVVQTRISNGNADPDMCGITKKEHNSLYYQKNREKILEHKREYRRRKKKQPSEESLW